MIQIQFPAIISHHFGQLKKHIGERHWPIFRVFTWQTVHQSIIQHASLIKKHMQEITDIITSNFASIHFHGDATDSIRNDLELGRTVHAAIP